MTSAAKRFRVPEWLSTNARGFLGGVAAVVTAVAVDQVVLPSDRARAAATLSTRLNVALPAFQEHVGQVRLTAATTSDAMLVGGDVSEVTASLREFRGALRGYGRSQDAIRQVLAADRLLSEDQDAVILSSFLALENLTGVIDGCLRRAVRSYGPEQSAIMIEADTAEETINCAVYTRGSVLIKLEDQLEKVNLCQNTVHNALTEVAYAADVERNNSVLASAGRSLTSWFDRSRPPGQAQNLAIDWGPIQLSLEESCTQAKLWPTDRQPNRGQVYPWERAIRAASVEAASARSATEVRYEEAVAADPTPLVQPINPVAQ
ncbi:hypothetical protein [Brevundimonas sp.]|uniref:hypothetical protein n=1 Tax=Brevundimonas sp. TaxID=1871086 RepID=UPI002622C527|nr:hypothetical protein [Brevundimonas sp.]